MVIVDVVLVLAKNITFGNCHVWQEIVRIVSTIVKLHVFICTCGVLTRDKILWHIKKVLKKMT